MKGVMRGILATFQSVAMIGSVIGTVSSGIFGVSVASKMIWIWI